MIAISGHNRLNSRMWEHEGNPSWAACNLWHARCIPQTTVLRSGAIAGRALWDDALCIARRALWHAWRSVACAVLWHAGRPAPARLRRRVLRLTRSIVAWPRRRRCKHRLAEQIQRQGRGHDRHNWLRRRQGRLDVRNRRRFGRWCWDRCRWRGGGCVAKDRGLSEGGVAKG